MVAEPKRNHDTTPRTIRGPRNPRRERAGALGHFPFETDDVVGPQGQADHRSHHEVGAVRRPRLRWPPEKQVRRAKLEQRRKYGRFVVHFDHPVMKPEKGRRRLLHGYTPPSSDSATTTQRREHQRYNNPTAAMIQITSELGPAAAAVASNAGQGGDDVERDRSRGRAHD